MRHARQRSFFRRVRFSGGPGRPERPRRANPARPSGKIGGRVASTGKTKTEQQRLRRARRAAEADATRTERDRLRERVRQLEARLARFDGDNDVYEQVVSAEADRNIAQRRAAGLEAQNAQLWAEVERLSQLAFPMTLYRPSPSTALKEIEIASAAALAALQGAPVAAWERSPLVAARRRQAAAAERERSGVGPGRTPGG